MKISKKLILLIILLVGILFLSAKTAFSEEKSDEFKLRQEILKFVPYKELNTLLAKQTKLVYMSYQELKKLIAEKSKPETPAPIDYVIKNLNLNGTIKDNYISFNGDYKIDLINKTWAKIPVLSTNTGLKNAILDEEQAKLIDENNFFNIITDETGEHTLKLQFDVKTTTSGNNNTVNFAIPNVSIASIKVKQPDNAPNIQIENTNGRIKISWKESGSKIQPVAHKKVNEKAANRPAKIVASANTLFSIDEGLLQGFSDYTFNIYHNNIEKLTFKIPEGIEVLDVTSPHGVVNKGNYGLEGDTLTVYFNTKVTDKLNLNITYEKNFENQQTELPLSNLYPVGDELSKFSGYVAVQSAGNSEIKTVKSENISRIDINELPYQLKNIAEYPLIAGYSHLKNNFNLALLVIPHKDAPVQVAMVDNASADSRLANNGIMTSKIEYTVRNMSEQFFRFVLPENSEILSAAINGVTQQVEKQDAEKISVHLVNIKKYQDSSPFKLTIMYRQKLNFNKIFSNIKLSLPDVLNMPVLTLSWSVYAPEGLGYFNFTDLNKGSYEYIGHLQHQNSQYGSYQSYNNRAAKQIASNYCDVDESTDDRKVSGILPPEFNMPPVKGLKRFNFSGYLTSPGLSKITMIGYTSILNYITALMLIFLAWKNRLYIKKILVKMKRNI